MNLGKARFGIEHRGAIRSTMRPRHPLPRIWLLTDPRLGDLERAISNLPKRAGIIFRHHELAETDRRALFDRVRWQARRGRHVLILAGSPQLARHWGADGAHDRSLRQSRGLRTAAVHSTRELVAARRAGADLLFISPVFSTRSHPGERTLGRVRLGLIAGAMRGRTVALGGLNGTRAKSLVALRIYGWAAIDAFGAPRVRI